MSTYHPFVLGTLIATGALITACSSSDDGATTAAASSRSYSGTASVGDFLTVRLDTVARTMHYHNTTNGDDYDVGYTLSDDGAYTFADPHGNLVTGYEVPGFAMVIQANKAGPGKNAPAVITAIQSTTVTTDVFRDKDYNYMQFRTSSGGMELGHVHCGADGTISPNGFWPYGHYNGDSAFHNASLPLTGITSMPDHSALVLSLVEDGVTENDYIFATTGGFLAVDTPNGAIVCMRQRGTSAFDATTMGGSYHAILYAKSDCQTGVGNVETAGSQQVMTGTMTIAADGTVNVVGSGGGPVVSGATLTPLSATELVGTGKLEDPCPGFFRFSNGDATAPRDIYLAFMTDAVLIASFTFNTATHHYDYFYGVGLRGSASASAALGHAAPPLAVISAAR